MKYFEGKVAWITGATSGIGEELVYQLNTFKTKTIISSRRESELERVKRNCQYPEMVYIQPLDLEDSSTFNEIVVTISKTLQQIDFLFNNGGISQRSYAEDTSLDIDRTIMEVNYFGNIALTKAVLPVMIKQKSGHIIATSSVAGKFGFFMRSAYSASKHALHGFYESLRLEQYEHNIKVSLVIPGPVNTNMSFNALLKDGSKNQKDDRILSEGLSPQKAAKKILKGVSAQKEEIMMGGKELIPIYIKRFFPGILTSILKNRKPQ